MATNYTGLEAGTALTGTEIIPMEQGGELKQTTAQDIADLGGSAVLPILNTYPVTTLGSAGTRFLYKGNEWHYMTADEIDSAGWTGLVSVGFPAPVNNVFTPEIISDTIPNPSSVQPTVQSTIYNPFDATSIIDFVGFGVLVYTVKSINFSGNSSVTTYKNAQFLINLKDNGTTIAFRAANQQLSAGAINDLFTQLPSTIQVATINVSGNAGAATCDQSIATNKGYIVVV